MGETSSVRLLSGHIYSVRKEWKRRRDYKIRQVKKEDLDALTEVEAVCFPEAEAAGREAFRTRLEAFPDCFFVAESEEGIIGFINGAATDHKTICDEMFEDTGLHRPDGAYQSVFGLDVAPQYRCRGIAAALMKHLIEKSRERGRKGVILTCKEALIPYYSRFGYRSLGVSESVHGGAVWYDMILEF